MDFSGVPTLFSGPSNVVILLLIFLLLSLLGIPYIRHRRRERARAADRVIRSVAPEQIMENFDLLNQHGVPEQVVNLMTTKEIMDILEREPKFEIVIDTRGEREY